MIHLINHPKAKTIQIREGRDGFWMMFQNGWGISVQWSGHNYCDGYRTQSGGTGKDAEIAVLLPEDKEREAYLPVPSAGLLDAPDGMSEVWGYLNEQEVLMAMIVVSGFANEITDTEAYQTFVRNLKGLPV